MKWEFALDVIVVWFLSAVFVAIALIEAFTNRTSQLFWYSLLAGMLGASTGGALVSLHRSLKSLENSAAPSNQQT